MLFMRKEGKQKSDENYYRKNVGSKSSDAVSYSIQKPMQKKFDLKSCCREGSQVTKLT